MAKAFNEKSALPMKGIGSDSVAIFEIAKGILAEAGLGKRVFLIHMPRGATPIVNGINQVTARLFPGKRPYEIVKVPYSRENLPSQAVARETFARALEGIPRKSTVFYVDETVTGRVASANAEDLQRALRKKGCVLKVHLMAANNASSLSKAARKSLRENRADITLHKIPGRIVWSDNTTVLGYNWGLLHRFPEEIILRATGSSRSAVKATNALKREYLQRYETLSRMGKEKKFREVQFSSPFYALRNRQAMQAFREAVEATGFGMHYKVEFSDQGARVEGRFIPFWGLGSFIFDNHPRAELENLGTALEKRAAYRRLLQSDPDTLIDLRRVSPESRANSRRLRRELSLLTQHAQRRKRKI